MFKGYSVAFPLVYDKQDGPYSLNKNMLDVVKQNLRGLILTEKGERIMIPEFGVGLNKFLFENMNQVTNIQLQSEVRDQVRKYMPFVEIREINTIEDPENLNKLLVVINFFVPALSLSDNLVLGE